MRHGSGKTFAVALLAPFQRRLLRIESENRVGDPSKVARAIDLQPEINRQNQVGEHCWHACDLHHVCRFLHPRESACERWGSLIHRLYESDQNYPPWRVASRLFLREAGLGFVGRPGDEEFISALVDLMEEGAGRKRGRWWLRGPLRMLSRGKGGRRGEPPTHNNQRPPACNHQAGIPGGTQMAKSTATSLQPPQTVIRHNACVLRNHHSMRSGPSQRKITQSDQAGPRAFHIRSHLKKKARPQRLRPV